MYDILDLCLYTNFWGIISSHVLLIHVLVTILMMVIVRNRNFLDKGEN